MHDTTSLRPGSHLRVQLLKLCTGGTQGFTAVWVTWAADEIDSSNLCVFMNPFMYHISRIQSASRQSEYGKGSPCMEAMVLQDH